MLETLALVLLSALLGCALTLLSQWVLTKRESRGSSSSSTTSPVFVSGLHVHPYVRKEKPEFTPPGQTFVPTYRTSDPPAPTPILASTPTPSMPVIGHVDPFMALLVASAMAMPPTPAEAPICEPVATYDPPSPPPDYGMCTQTYDPPPPSFNDPGTY